MNDEWANTVVYQSSHLTCGQVYLPSHRGTWWTNWPFAQSPGLETVQRVRSFWLSFHLPLSSLKGPGKKQVPVIIGGDPLAIHDSGGSEGEQTERVELLQEVTL